MSLDSRAKQSGEIAKLSVDMFVCLWHFVVVLLVHGSHETLASQEPVDGEPFALSTPPLPGGWSRVDSGDDAVPNAYVNDQSGRRAPRGVHPLIAKHEVNKALQQAPDFRRAFNEVRVHLALACCRRFYLKQEHGEPCK